MSGRFVLLGSIIYLLFFLGLITMNPGPLVLAIPLVTYMGASLLNRPPRIEMSAERTLEYEHVTQGTPLRVRLKVSNQGPELEEALIEDVLPEGLVVTKGHTRTLAHLPTGESVELEYTIQGPRGSYDWRQVQVTAGDHLGILRQVDELPARSQLVYLPTYPRLKKVAIRPPRTIGHSGPIPARKPGAGTDFYFLREYQLGDPRRWINWRTSTRHEQLYVNQFEQERIAEVSLILDARQQSEVVLRDGRSLFESAVQATGALANAFIDDANRVGLLIYGFGMERVFPGYGRVQKERILQVLGAARTGHNFALESLRYLPTRFFPTGSQIVMVSPLMASDLPAFTRLRASGYEVLVVSPDPVDFEARGMGQYGKLPWQLAKLERAVLLHKLTRLGVQVLDWDVAEPFEPLVRQTLSRPRAAQRRVIV